MALSTLLCAVGSAVAAEEAAPPKPRLLFDISFAVRYDDNILHLSNCDRAALDSGNQRQPCANAPGHRATHAADRIETVDDNVLIGGFQTRWITRPFSHRTTIVGGSFEIYQFLRNPIKNWNEWSVSFDQELSAARKHLTALRAGVSYTPSYYLRELRDDNGSVAAGRPVYASAIYAQTRYGLALDQEIVNNRMNAVASAELEARNYDAPFNERDGKRTDWTLSLRGRPSSKPRTQLALSYAWGRLDAAGDNPSTPIVERDISYDHHGFQFDGSIDWGARYGGRVSVRAQDETREFTTQNKFDIYRYGRVDDRREYRLNYLQRLTRRFDLVAEWSRWTDQPRLAIASLDPDGDVTGFVENRYTLSFRCHLQKR